MVKFDQAFWPLVKYLTIGHIRTVGQIWPRSIWPAFPEPGLRQGITESSIFFEFAQSLSSANEDRKTLSNIAKRYKTRLVRDLSKLNKINEFDKKQ